jgi:micrococcal nuclease
VDYEYKVSEIEVVDGDTIRATVDLGFRIFTRETFRLAGINAPETRGKDKVDGRMAKEYLESRIDERELTYTVETTKDKKGKYGRYLAVLYECANQVKINLNDHMVLAGHAKYQKY